MDFSLLAKHQKAGPRYTSYPTALEFSKDFSYEAYCQILRELKGDLSLYFHLPFCRSACYFCGCNVIYTSKQDMKTRYLEYLFREIDLMSELANCRQRVVQMHFGGGTPTFFSAKELDSLLVKIKSVFTNFDALGEFSCEIDPRFLNEEQVEVLTSHGINRVSFGAQDFNEEVQKEIHRIQPFEMTKNAVDLVRKYGIKSVNMDLIYGLPLQTFASFKETLEKALLINPDRLAIFNYAHIPWLKKNMRKFDERSIPAANVKLEILEYTANFLEQNGYEMIGMDHFAKPQDELFISLKNHSLHRNFQGYTTRAGAALLGLGLTSIGEGKMHYAQNHKEMNDYEAAIDEGKLPFFKGVLLGADDLIRKRVIMSLMANYYADFGQIARDFNISWKEYFAQSFAQLEYLKDFYELKDGILSVKNEGVLLIRNIAMCFDAYLANKGANTFSKTI